MNIYIGNLGPSITTDILKAMFVEFGEVESCKIISDRRSGRSKGFGFVEMENNDEAKKAVSGLNGSSLKSRDITVNEAKPRG